MRLSIIGSGHVGLVTGACLAELGHQVVCVDSDASKVSSYQKGKVPFYEPHLEDLVQANLRQGRIAFTRSIAEGVRHGEAIFVSVNTPALPDGSADLSSVERVCREIARYAEGYCIVVEKSTVPVATGEAIKRTLEGYGNGRCEFDVASVPEFLREGSAVHDFLHPDRIVLGVESPRAEQFLCRLFEPLDAPVLVTDLKSAELIKHASNSFLALKISYINALAEVCERAGADVGKVAEGMGLDKRIGSAFLGAGVGYGGACFPKDVAAFAAIARKLGYDFRLLEEVERINQGLRQRLVQRLQEALGALRDRRVGVLGLAFKPNTDDMRNAPAVEVITELLAGGAQVIAYDPRAQQEAQRVLPPGVQYAHDPYQVASDADALAILTDWEEFRALDWASLRGLMRRPLVVDGRNMFDPGAMAAQGFEYHSFGRPSLTPAQR